MARWLAGSQIVKTLLFEAGGCSSMMSGHLIGSDTITAGHTDLLEDDAQTKYVLGVHEIQLMFFNMHCLKIDE